MKQGQDFVCRNYAKEANIFQASEFQLTIDIVFNLLIRQVNIKVDDINHAIKMPLNYKENSFDENGNMHFGRYVGTYRKSFHSGRGCYSFFRPLGAGIIQGRLLFEGGYYYNMS